VRYEALYTMAVHTGPWRAGYSDSSEPTLTSKDAGSPKNNANRRVPVPLNKTAVTVLRVLWARQDEERLRLGDLWQDHNLVFPNRVV